MRAFGAALALLAVALVRPTQAAWQLEWSDEFNGDTLNASNWNAINASDPGSNQIELYMAYNAYVQDGALVLRSKLDNVTIGPHSWNVSSGRVDSSFKRNVTYGRVDVRAKLQNPAAIGIHTAHWLLGYDCWPRGGELDIMESEVETAGWVRSTSCIHIGPGCGQQYDQNKDGAGVFPDAPDGQNPVNFTSDWHVFSVEWNATDVIYYVYDSPSENITANGTVVRAWHEGWDGKWNVTVPHWPMYLILSQAYMVKRRSNPPDWAWPVYQYIDYVRVYRQVTEEGEEEQGMQDGEGGGQRHEVEAVEGRGDREGRQQGPAPA